MPHPDTDSRLLRQYLHAKRFVVDSGFSHEVGWQENVRVDRTTESDFLKEAAWVIVNCGFRESVARRLFPGISEAFLEWHGSTVIAIDRARCERMALAVLNNRRKIRAIADIADFVAFHGFEHVKHRLLAEGPSFFELFSYFGPVTSLHLAKNLGLPLAKPDRHLRRVADVVGFESAQSLCETIAESVGDTVAVVDLVIWRFATLRRDYLAFFASASVVHRE